MTHIVVIGAGQAGASLVGKLRAEGYDGRVTLLGAEDGPPYQRPALSKAYLLGEMERERLFLRPREWYEGNEISLRTGTRAVAVDAAAQTVTLASDEVLHYDHLALTTGSHPRQLPAAIGGKVIVHTASERVGLQPDHDVLVVDGYRRLRRALDVPIVRSRHKEVAEAVFHKHA